jgi:hypothetical protein
LKIVALLPWYSESPGFLHDCISSLPTAGVSDVVCVDGAYAAFKGAKRRSSQAEHDALKAAAKAAGIRVHVTTPPKPWDTEVAKRNYLFRKGERLTTEDDWFLVIDADEQVTKADDLHARLQAANFIVAAGTLEEPHPTLPTTHAPMRRLYKALRGIHLKGSHDTYELPDGRVLWGRQNRVGALDLQAHFSLLHRTHFRNEQRRQASKEFYADRTARREEAWPCGICGKPGVSNVPYDWERIDETGAPGTRGRLGAKSMWACERHAQQLNADGAAVLRAWGFDPAGARSERQNV